MERFDEILLSPCFLVSDLSVFNKNISQRWRRLRRRCSSFTTPSLGPCTSPPPQCERLLLSADHPVVVNMPPTGTATPLCSSTSNRPLFSEVLLTKLNRLHAGLRKRRAVSVHEMCSSTRGQPTFYVPSPLSKTCEEERPGPVSLPPITFRDGDTRHRKVSSTCSSGRGTATPPTEDLDGRSTDSTPSSTSSSRCRRKSCSPSPPQDHGYDSIEGQERRSRRWSAADQPCGFVIGGSVSCGFNATPEPGPTSLPYTPEEDTDVHDKQRQLIQHLQEALGEKKKEIGGLRWNHRSSGDLLQKGQEVLWRSKVCDFINTCQDHPHLSLARVITLKRDLF